MTCRPRNRPNYDDIGACVALACLMLGGLPIVAFIFICGGR